jgi:hypothetical protein
MSISESNDERAQPKPDLFEKCRQIKQVGLPKLTMGMFGFSLTATSRSIK